MEDGEAPIIRETPPVSHYITVYITNATPPQVQVTHTPEYFGFWQGKPLSVREFGVKVHKRHPWTRVKSAWGSGQLIRRGGGKENSGSSGDQLETLVERDSDSLLNSRRGSRDVGHHDNSHHNGSGSDHGQGTSEGGLDGEGGHDQRQGSQDTDLDHGNTR